MIDTLLTLCWRRCAPLAAAWVAATACAQGMPPNADAGRELFAAHCSRCHGGDATGTANGPDLRRRVKGMSEDGFAAAVLQRYRFTLPAAEAGGEGAAREALLRGLLVRRQDGAEMPAWQSNATIAAGVKSLYAFLNAPAR